MEIAQPDVVVRLAPAGLFGGVMLMVWLAIYVYYAVAFMTIANKTGTENAWMAWVPILNMWLMVQIAEKEAWWMILFFIPVLNLVSCDRGDNGHRRKGRQASVVGHIDHRASCEPDRAGLSGLGIRPVGGQPAM